MDTNGATMALLLLMSLLSPDSARGCKQIQVSSKLYPSTHPTSWASPSALFAFGFYPQGSGFAIGIWLVGNNRTVVWTANRDDPPLSSNATLQLTMQGKLVVQTNQGLSKPIAIVDGAASFACMLDSGNFVLYNRSSGVIWQSFDDPTDTILGDQSLHAGRHLLSSSSGSNHCSGRFRLEMQTDGNLVSYPRYTSDTGVDANWASDTRTPNGYLYLNKTGTLLIRNDSNSPIRRPLYDASTSNTDNENNKAIYRATLDFDGVFRLYKHDSKDASKISNVSSWPSDITNVCDLKGYCGFNSYCTVNDGNPYCKCLPGFDIIDPNQNTCGCDRSFSEAKCGGDEKHDAESYYMVSVDNLVWGSNDRPYAQANISSKDKCSSWCLHDCNCWAALYQDNGLCMKQEPPLRFARRTSNNGGSSSSSLTAIFKVGNLPLNGTRDKPFGPGQPPPIKTTSKTAIVKIILVTSSFTLLLCSTIGISSHLIYKIRVLRYKRLLEIGDLGLNEEVALRRFSHSELKKATNGFKQELGSGYFGAVYKGVLYRGRSRRLIAVKRLERLVEEGERQFQAEVRAIGKTHHRNLVRLLGFCADGPKRLLVYEYMSNGSLGNLLFGDVARPDWDERVRIALDVARGILYLHEECEAPIIHCDIKPQNILMDECWTAKISDFGLAKLLMPDQTRTFTGVRGTRGYLAPEWNKNTPITVKADIYSYGVVLLETICCRRNIEVNISKPEETLLSGWAYECFLAGELHKLVHWETVDKNVLENMVKVALWCIQDEPAIRPSMKSVVLMLEGIIDVAIPPPPTSNSM